jgi:hypothetical protein
MAHLIRPWRVLDIDPERQIPLHCLLRVKSAPDALRVQSLSRVLHFPGYVLGQIDYYRAEYEKTNARGLAEVEDLLPMDLLLAGPLRAAYQQVLLGRALGVIDVGDLGDSHLAAARRLASKDAAVLRERLETALAPHLSIAADVERTLRQFWSSATLSPLDHGVLDTLDKRYAGGLAVRRVTPGRSTFLHRSCTARRHASWPPHA